MPTSPGMRASSGVINTSGNSPICVSGMASRLVASTTRWEPWALSPSPPPIVMPVITARYGLPNPAIARFTPYSVSKKSRTSPPVSASSRSARTSAPAHRPAPPTR